MSLGLSPAEGYPATHFTATLTGVSACLTGTSGAQLRSSSPVSFQWDSGTLEHESGSGDSANDSATINFTVPADTEPGAHTVAVVCGQYRVPAWFTVLPPTLKLNPGQGTPGSLFTASVTGFGACTQADVSFRWDEDTTLQSTRSGLSTFAVPNDAPTTGHSVTAACGRTHSQAATFKVVAAPKPTLALDPAQGTPGISFEATVTGFDACAPADLSFRWDGDTKLEPSSQVAGDTFTLAVPKDASTDDHSVTASCSGTEASPVTFKVLAVPKPTLTLEPGYGQPGFDVTAEGAGFACDGDVQLLWDDTFLADRLAGRFTVSFKVPSIASPDGHTVVASCANDPNITASEHFTVTSVPPPMTRSPAPALTLRPTSGYSGDRVQVDGRRLPCANLAGPVNLSWDDGTNLTDASLDQSGNFATSVLVTPKTDGGRLTMRATCADGVVLAADFTVLSSSPLPPERNYWWVLWLIVGIAALVYFLRRLRPSKPKPKPALPHIYAVAHPDGVPIVSVRATPKRGESTHNLRLEAHADLGTQTVREVDDDHTHAR